MQGNISQLRWNPLVIGVNGTGVITGSRIGGFLPVTTGTLTLVRNNEDGTTTTLLSGFPVTAGLWVDIPFYLSNKGGTVTLALGASGIAAV